MALTIYDPKISWSRVSVAEDFSKKKKSFVQVQFLKGLKEANCCVMILQQIIF